MQLGIHYADFSHDGKPQTLADDLQVDGTVRSQPLPAPAQATTVAPPHTYTCRPNWSSATRRGRARVRTALRTRAT